jgi:hypothetical protein
MMTGIDGMVYLARICQWLLREDSRLLTLGAQQAPSGKQMGSFFLSLEFMEFIEQIFGTRL